MQVAAGGIAEDGKHTSLPSADRSFGPSMNKPAGKGARFIILNAVTKDGWVKNAQLVFQAQRRTGDYHGSMDEENFSNWFITQLLPNILITRSLLWITRHTTTCFLKMVSLHYRAKKCVLQQWFAREQHSLQ